MSYAVEILTFNELKQDYISVWKKATQEAGSSSGGLHSAIDTQETLLPNKKLETPGTVGVFNKVAYFDEEDSAQDAVNQLNEAEIPNSIVIGPMLLKD